MLTEGTESRETRLANIQGAMVYLLLVTRTSEMLIKAWESGESTMTEIALIHAPIPRCPCGIERGHFMARIAASDKTRRVSNDVVCVILANVTVDGGTVGSRATTT